MTSNNLIDVIVSIKLCLDVGKYFILCNFGGITRGFRGEPPKPTHPGRREQKKKRFNDKLREMSSRKHCGYKLQIVLGHIAQLFLHGI